MPKVDSDQSILRLRLGIPIGQEACASRPAEPDLIKIALVPSEGLATSIHLDRPDTLCFAADLILSVLGAEENRGMRRSEVPDHIIAWAREHGSQQVALHG